MNTTLYRKYRPATFSKIIGQRHVVQTLKNAVKSGRIGQAYLFAGPRGTGKTSIARIFSKTINCNHLKNGEPCLRCDSCKNILDNRALDIIEIDAASNTGVDNIRELRETVKLPPSLLKYKVYIIDEVHMLSGGAFNALLKTLEEPPAHIVFILATTEVHKIPETILSRVQRFDFTRLTIEEIVNRLEDLAKLEKVKIDREALGVIASSSEGGMRNAESLLGQIIALEDKKITIKEVEFILGNASEKFTARFVDLIINQNYPEAFVKINELRETGIDFKNFGKSLLNYFRQMLVLKMNPELGKKISYEMTKERLEQIQNQLEKTEISEILNLIEIIQKNMEIFKSSPIPQLFLEISIAKLVPQAKKDSTFISNAISCEPKKEICNSATYNSKENIDNQAPIPDPEEKEMSSSKKLGDSTDIDFILTNWQNIIDSLKSYNHSLSSVLKMCQPEIIEGKYLILKTKYSFYNDKISESENRLTIEKTIDKITGVNLRLKPLTEKEFKDQYGNTKQKKSLLQEAVDIFGGKIVKE